MPNRFSNGLEAISLEDMAPAELNDWYENVVGYRPQEDDPTMSDEELRRLCIEVRDHVPDDE